MGFYIIEQDDRKEVVAPYVIDNQDRKQVDALFIIVNGNRERFFARAINKSWSETLTASESTNLDRVRTIERSETAELSETWPQPDTESRVTVPNAPSNVSVSEITCDDSTQNIEITFDDNSDNESTWNVYKDGVLYDSVPTSSEGTTGSETITATGGPNTPGETANFTMTAENSAGESSESSADTFTFRDLPPNPTNVSATWNSDLCNVSISWDSMSDTCEYEVYRDGTSIGTTTNNAFTDSNASANTNYQYEVEGINDHGTSSGTGSDSITTGNCEGPS